MEGLSRHFAGFALFSKRYEPLNFAIFAHSYKICSQTLKNQRKRLFTVILVVDEA